MTATREAESVFPGGKRDKPLSNMALLSVLRRMGRSDLTAHGFRSTFRDWAAERTNFRREVAEAALAHTVATKSRPPTAAASSLLILLAVILILLCDRIIGIDWMLGIRRTRPRR